MGIKGLNKIIKKVAPNILKERHVSEYANTKIAIDSSILMYKYRYCSQGPQGQNSHIFGFFQRACFYLYRGILPVFAFDGAPPTEKQFVIEKRSNHKLRLQEKIDNLRARSYSTTSDSASIPSDTEEKIEKLNRQIIYVTKQHRHECRYLLRLLGIPVLDANGEAEQACAELQKKGIVQYSFTEDSDSLTFGSPVILRSSKKLDTVIEVSLGDVLRELGLTYDSFVDFCILCGCDYTGTIPKIGPVTALSLVQEHKNIETILNTLPDRYKVPDDFDYVKARELFKTPATLPDMCYVLGEPSWDLLQTFLVGEIGVSPQEYATMSNKYRNALYEYRKIVGPKKMAEYFSMSWKLLVNDTTKT